MKRKLIIVLLVLISLFFCSCNSTFDGYNYNIEDVRKNDISYDTCDYIFTIQQDNTIIDFLINGDLLHIKKIDCQERLNQPIYKIKSTATYSISESLTTFESTQEDYWVKSGNYPIQIEWSIVSKQYNDLHQDLDFEGFDFIYNNEDCVLRYRIGNSK